jgi:Methyltransferase domain
MATSRLPGTFDRLLARCISASHSRLEFWVQFIQSVGVQSMLELGVYGGDFAALALRRCDSIGKYYMIDPWRHLEDWNKPANQDDSQLEDLYQESKRKTEFAAAKRIILRGKTTEVIDQIADAELDFAYVDADHTLKGIAIDLIRVYPKVRVGGFIGGDDFTPSVWEHNTSFEPTLVFPFAVYFAEAVGAAIYGLPRAQFVLEKTERPSFTFVDLTGQYRGAGLRDQFVPERMFKLFARERFPRLARLAGKAKSFVRG